MKYVAHVALAVPLAASTKTPDAIGDAMAAVRDDGDFSFSSLSSDSESESLGISSMTSGVSSGRKYIVRQNRMLPMFFLAA